MPVPLTRLDARIVPVFFGTMLASVLVSRRSALALNVFLAFIIGAICAWNVGLLSTTMLSTVMMTIVGGTAAVLALYRPAHRASLIIAGLIAGGINTVIVVLMGLVSAVGLSADTLLLGRGVCAGQRPAGERAGDRDAAGVGSNIPCIHTPPSSLSCRIRTIRF